MSSIQSLLSNNTPLILDGALATYLETLGADLSGALWSAQILQTQPELIHRTHLDYFKAGADVAITASYQASIPGLRRHLNVSEEQACELVRKSVELAKGARDEYLASLSKEEGGERNLFVAGSVGPYGAFLADGSEYRGDYSVPKEEMKAFHRGRIRALVDAGVDVLACETMPSFAEIEALVEVLREEFQGTMAWFSFTIRDAERISDGTTLERVAGVLDGVEQLVAIGVNCVPEGDAEAALKTLRRFTEKPLVCYPNSGEVWDAEKREWAGSRNEGLELQEWTGRWYRAGARLIGGCCRTTPEDIRVHKKILEAIR